MFIAIKNVTLKNVHANGMNFCGADGRDRTCDLLVTNELLYQLSYIGTSTLYHTLRGLRCFLGFSTFSPAAERADKLRARRSLERA